LRPASGDATLTHVRMHADQMPVPYATVRALIAEQFPQWQALPVRRIASRGTVNAIFRIGDDLAARFPLRPGDAEATRRWHLGCGDLEWQRGQAWAFEQAMGVVWYYAETNPAMSRMGCTTLERILADSRTMDE
jgi:hypothetical protein